MFVFGLKPRPCSFLHLGPNLPLTLTRAWSLSDRRAGRDDQRLAVPANPPLRAAAVIAIVVARTGAKPVALLLGIRTWDGRKREAARKVAALEVAIGVVVASLVSTGAASRALGLCGEGRNRVNTADGTD
jgi:hypothetical protein